ncbi:MAG: hypothetical protein M1835_007763 [Candelina submexicana]|nr:MAG: hypothetical protein M1835_007763 [Candelina submexicana]
MILPSAAGRGHPLAQPKAVTATPSALDQVAVGDLSNELEEGLAMAEIRVSLSARPDTVLRSDPVGVEDRRKLTLKATDKNAEKDMKSAAAVATEVLRDVRDGETLAARPL